MEQTLFIAAAFNLEIQGDTRAGIEMRKGIYLTNNVAHVRSFLTPRFEEAVGNLEYGPLWNAKAVFYQKCTVQINSDNEDNLLSDFLASCKLALLELWLLRDHAIDIMMGYVHWPFYGDAIVQPPNDDSTIHSNLLSGRVSNASGQYIPARFNIAELQAQSRPEREIRPFSEPSGKSTAFLESFDRYNRCSVFIQTAREANDLGIRIGHYCSALECLLGTDSAELTHKLSERVAWLLSDNAENRVKIYRQVKALYTIRSRVIHGSVLTKSQQQDLSRYSEIADGFLRQLLNIAEMDESTGIMFNLDNSALDAKFLELVMGVPRQ